MLVSSTVDRAETRTQDESMGLAASWCCVRQEVLWHIRGLTSSGGRGGRRSGERFVGVRA